MVCSQQTPRLSIRVAQERRVARQADDLVSQQMLDDIARDRGTSIARLQRRLRGDLDTIVLNALKKEPRRRYRSVSAFADDIDLHMKSIPILARTDSWRYRTGKFLRRHYAAVSASLLFVAVLIAFSVLLTLKNRDVVKERDTARAVSQFLEEIFQAQDPARARGVNVTAREILATGASRIRTDLHDRPEIQSALIGTIGRVYTSLGEYRLAADMLEQALQLRQIGHKPNDPSVAAAKQDLAGALILRAEYQRARELLSSALETNKEVHGEASRQVAQNMNSLAILHLRTGELEMAGTFAAATIEIYAEVGTGIELAAAKATFARILQFLGQLDKTEVLLLEAIELVANSEGPNHPQMAFYLQNLGALQRTKGDTRTAKETLGRAIVTAKRILGEKHDLVAAILLDQGILMHMSGDLNAAEQAIREALALYVQIHGDDVPVVGYTLTVLGMLLHDKFDLPGAENVLRSAILVYDEALDDNHQYMASALTELGAVLNSTDHLAEAESILDRALTISLKDYSSEHELVAATRTEYADTLTRLGLLEQAEPLLLDSVDALRNRPGRRQQRATAALSRLYDQKKDAQND